MDDFYDRLGRAYAEFYLTERAFDDIDNEEEISVFGRSGEWQERYTTAGNNQRAAWARLWEVRKELVKTNA
jgi:hypothetical protein